MTKNRPLVPSMFCFVSTAFIPLIPFGVSEWIILSLLLYGHLYILVKGEKKQFSS